MAIIHPITYCHIIKFFNYCNNYLKSHIYNVFLSLQPSLITAQNTLEVLCLALTSVLNFVDITLLCGSLEANLMLNFYCRPFIKSFIQGFLPGIALKIFLIFLPTILMIMSKFEGFISLSALERRSATRYYIFQFINVFLGSIITGTAFQQLDKFIHQSANE